MVAFNATLIVQVVNFFILLFLLDRLFFKKVARVLAERRDFLANAEKTVASQMAELGRMTAEHTAAIESARQEAQAVIQGQLAAAERDKAKILADVRSELETQQAATRIELAEQVAAAEAGMRSELGALAEQIADKVLTISRQPVLR